MRRLLFGSVAVAVALFSIIAATTQLSVKLTRKSALAYADITTTVLSGSTPTLDAFDIEQIEIDMRDWDYQVGASDKPIAYIALQYTETDSASFTFDHSLDGTTWIASGISAVEMPNGAANYALVTFTDILTKKIRVNVESSDTDDFAPTFSLIYKRIK